MNPIKEDGNFYGRRKNEAMKRHYCTFCGKKADERTMSLVGSRLLKKEGWICKEHLSAGADIFEVRESGTKPVFLELFSGSGHVAAAARCAGFEAWTVDNEQKFNPDICIDVCNLRRSALPENVHVVWASIPCTTYSKLMLEKHWEKICIGYRRYYYLPRSPRGIEALRILAATIKLIVKLKPTYFFLENPVGAFRHMPHLYFIPYRHTVSYLDYGFEYLKPTDIFTNNPYFKPKPFTMPNVPPVSSLLAQPNAHTRSLIPPGLITEMIDSIRHLV